MCYRRIAAVFALVGLLGCDKLLNPLTSDDVGGTVPSGIVGTWVATSFLLVNKADTTQTVDLIQIGGFFSVTIDSNGNYGAVSFFGQEESEAGTIKISGNLLIITKTGETPDTSSFTLSGNVMVVTNEKEAYDFDGNDVEEPARTVIILHKEGSDQAGNDVPAEVVGTWDATHYLLTNKANTAQSVDLILIGGEWTLAIDSAGAYTSTQIGRAHV